MAYSQDMPRPEKNIHGRSTHRPRGRPRKSQHAALPGRPPEYAEFAARLERVRAAMGLSPRALALRCKVTPTNMGQYLAGAMQPGFDVLRRMSEQLGGLSVDWLLLGDGGDEPVYRERSRTRSEFEEEFAVRFRHAVVVALDAAVPDLKPEMLAVDVPRVLEAAVERETTACVQALRDAARRHAILEESLRASRELYTLHLAVSRDVENRKTQDLFEALLAQVAAHQTEVREYVRATGGAEVPAVYVTPELRRRGERRGLLAGNATLGYLEMVGAEKSADVTDPHRREVAAYVTALSREPEGPFDLGDRDGEAG